MTPGAPRAVRYVPKPRRLSPNNTLTPWCRFATQKAPSLIVFVRVGIRSFVSVEVIVGDNVTAFEVVAAHARWFFELGIRAERPLHVGPSRPVQANDSHQSQVFNLTNIGSNRSLLRAFLMVAK